MSGLFDDAPKNRNSISLNGLPRFTGRTISSGSLARFGGVSLSPRYR